MKRSLQNFIALILLLSPMCMTASSAYTLVLSKVIIFETPDKNKETPRRNRLPSAPIDCVITSDGIYVQDSSINLAEALSYEVWDVESEFCIATFEDVPSFIDGLFSMTGELQIRIVFSDCEFVGNVSH